MNPTTYCVTVHTCTAPPRQWLALSHVLLLAASLFKTPLCAMWRLNTIFMCFGENYIYDTETALHMPYASGHPGISSTFFTWCRAITDAIVYPKRPGTLRDTPHPRAPAEYPDRCRRQRYLRHKCRKYILRHRGTLNTQDDPEHTTASLACFVAIVEAMVYSKLPTTGQGTPYRRAPVE